MLYTVFDIESDGLLDTATKIHCVSYNILDENFESVQSGTILDYEQMKLFFKNQQHLIGHNIIRFDIPLLKKILGIHIEESVMIIDTLGLSWYLFPMTKDAQGRPCVRRQHGLEAWGKELDTRKIQISDWQNLPEEAYTLRCEVDVVINTLLWIKEFDLLREIYDGDMENMRRIINYLGFKLDCAREQEENPCIIDRKACERHLDDILAQIEVKTEELAKNMPQITKYKTITKPASMTKKDGSLSVAGEKWLNLIQENNLDPNVESIDVVASIEEGNPNSGKQVKDWLFSLGWIPTLYKDSVSKVTGEVKEVPQISVDGEICPNIQKLYKDHPYLEALEGLTILNHRKGVFEAFLETMDSNNRVVARIDGFTNTLRMQHRKPIANLTKVSKPWGKEIRGLITVEDKENYCLCGSDMTALEDTTKQHYMYFFDPEYVKQMRVPGFDPHTDISVLAGIMTKEEETFYKDFKKGKIEKTPENEAKYHDIEDKRYKGKTTNFSAVYGAGPPKMAKGIGCSLEFAQKLHKAYWQRNKAVKQVTEHVRTKQVRGQYYLHNPISKFWYSLRVLKDAFSTLNQGTGVYCFDNCIMEYRKRGIKISLQYHDEVMFMLLKLDQEKSRNILNESVQAVNDRLKLNVPLGCSADFGDNYALIH